ncbi:MAG TPA: transaldolase [Acidobacteriaceae bacterium]|nr:transaldolase [Acidobacteriaceae bacterium]
MKKIEDLRIRLFSDGADFAGIMEMYSRPWVRGFTTNPTLMRKAGVRNYEAFARSLLRAIPDRPVSLEVFADDEEQMEMQALTVATWGANVNVKIPVTNRAGVLQTRLIRTLSEAGVAVNVTAILTLEQVEQVVGALAAETGAIVSIFAGRIADTGVDPVPVMAEAKRILRWRPRAQLLWASPREVLNVFQAEDAGCDIITLPPEMLRKLELVGRDLKQYSLETVEMFHHDARAVGYVIDTSGLAAAKASGQPAGRTVENNFGRFREITCDVVGAGIGSASTGVEA